MNSKSLGTIHAALDKLVGSAMKFSGKQEDFDMWMSAFTSMCKVQGISAGEEYANIVSGDVPEPTRQVNARPRPVSGLGAPDPLPADVPAGGDADIEASNSSPHGT